MYPLATFFHNMKTTQYASIEGSPTTLNQLISGPSVSNELFRILKNVVSFHQCIEKDMKLHFDPIEYDTNATEINLHGTTVSSNVAAFITIEDVTQFLPSTAKQSSSLTSVEQCDISYGQAYLWLIYSILYSNILIQELGDSTLSKEVKQLQNFKMLLIDYVKITDRILQFYLHKTGNLPDFELELHELQKGKNELVKTISNLNPKELCEFFYDKLKITDDDLLCSVLGLKSSIAKELHNIDSDLRGHQSDLYYISDIVVDRVQHYCDQSDGNLQIFEILTSSGFTIARANLLVNLFNTELREHENLAYWVENYLEYMFENDIFLKNECPKFPLHEDMMDHWFDVPTEYYDIDGADDDFVLIKNIPIINLYSGDAKQVVKDGLVFGNGESNEEFWFHGTTHNAAEHIRENGIQLSKGKSKQDFSDGDGFYLTPFYDNAFNWAKMKGCGQQGAVVIFRFNLDTEEGHGCNLEGQDELWSEIVKYNRSGRQRNVLSVQKFGRWRKNHNEHSFILGSTSSGGSKNYTFNCNPTTNNGNNSVQLCVKSEKLAAVLSNHIFGIVCFCTP